MSVGIRDNVDDNRGQHKYKFLVLTELMNGLGGVGHLVPSWLCGRSVLLIRIA